MSKMSLCRVCGMSKNVQGGHVFDILACPPQNVKNISKGFFATLMYLKCQERMSKGHVKCQEMSFGHFFDSLRRTPENVKNMTFGDFFKHFEEDTPNSTQIHFFDI